jgi:hypothetical protein
MRLVKTATQREELTEGRGTVDLERMGDVTNLGDVRNTIDTQLL